MLYGPWLESIYRRLVRRTGYHVATLATELGIGDPLDDGFWRSPGCRALRDALAELDSLGLGVVDAPIFGISLSQRGRELGAKAFRTLRDEVEALPVSPEADTWLTALVDLCEKKLDGAVALRSVADNTVRARLGWIATRPMGSWWDAKENELDPEDVDLERRIAAIAWLLESYGLARMSLDRSRPTARGVLRTELRAADPARSERLEADEASVAIFISYAHEDSGLARVLARGLAARGARVWVDEGQLRLGDSLMRVLDAIPEVNYLLALVSPRSTSSRWCQKELAIAISSQLRGRSLAVLPLRVDDAEMPPALSDTYYLRVDRSRLSELIDRIIEDVKTPLR